MKKNLGQHFLTSNDIAKTAVVALGPIKGKTVIEIGPGTGILTDILLKNGAYVVAIEKDTVLAEKLEKRLIGKKLKVIQGDARDFDPNDYNLQSTTYNLIGNIPYYITGRILRISLSAHPQPSRAVFMVQKEVAQRIIAKNGKESILSISIKAYGTPCYIRTVKRGSFNPVPNVDSAILSIENISRNLFKNTDEIHFFETVKKGFAHKRKLLKNNLELSEKTLSICDIPLQARAEELTLEQWICIAQNTQNLEWSK